MKKKKNRKKDKEQNGKRFVKWRWFDVDGDSFQNDE